MRIPRLYQQSSLAEGMKFTLSHEAAHHVVNVLRMRSGQALILFNGEGGYFEAVIEQVNRHSVEVVLGHHYQQERESPLDLTLVQGISRGNRMDMTLQKAVELGISRLVPVQTEFCNVRLDQEKRGKRMEHWHKVVIAACEQCGRNRLPEIEKLQTLTEWLSRETSAKKMILDPAGKISLAGGSTKPAQVVLLAGPEGGFSDKEVQMALERGYEAVSLGPRILRTETAALAAVAACQTLWGDICPSE